MGCKLRRLTVAALMISGSTLTLKPSLPDISYPEILTLRAIYDLKEPMYLKNDRAWDRNMLHYEENSYWWTRQISLINFGKEDVPDLVRKGSKVVQVKTSSNYTALSTGIQYLDVHPGTGDSVGNNKKVTLNYELFVKDMETCVKSTFIKGSSITFRLGKKKICPGFEEGIVGMKEKGRRFIVVPPELSCSSWFSTKKYKVYYVELIDVRD